MIEGAPEALTNPGVKLESDCAAFVPTWLPLNEDPGSPPPHKVGLRRREARR